MVSGTQTDGTCVLAQKNAVRYIRKKYLG